MRKSTSYIVFFTFFAILITILTITIHELSPVFANFNNQEAFQRELDAYIKDLGPLRAILLAFLQFSTVIMMVLPAEPVEIVSGLSYGIFLGAIICLTGTIIANITIYCLFKKMGDQITKFYPNYEQWERKALYNIKTKNRIINILILYLLPVIPYGTIAIIASRSKLRFLPYIIVTSLGALPSIMTCTLMTGSLLKGNVMLSIIIITIIILIIIGTIIYRIIEHQKNKIKNKKNI